MCSLTHTRGAQPNARRSKCNVHQLVLCIQFLLPSRALEATRSFFSVLVDVVIAVVPRSSDSSVSMHFECVVTHRGWRISPWNGCIAEHAAEFSTHKLFAEICARRELICAPFTARPSAVHKWVNICRIFVQYIPSVWIIWIAYALPYFVVHTVEQHDCTNAICSYTIAPCAAHASHNHIMHRIWIRTHTCTCSGMEWSGVECGFSKFISI